MDNRNGAAAQQNQAAAADLQAQTAVEQVVEAEVHSRIHEWVHIHDDMSSINSILSVPSSSPGSVSELQSPGSFGGMQSPGSGTQSTESGESSQLVAKSPNSELTEPSSKRMRMTIEFTSESQYQAYRKLTQKFFEEQEEGLAPKVISEELDTGEQLDTDVEI